MVESLRWAGIWEGDRLQCLESWLVHEGVNLRLKVFIVVVNWEMSSRSSLNSVDCADADGCGLGTTVGKAGRVVWVGATSRMLSASLAKLAISMVSLFGAKMSCTLVGRR